jgi:ABC-type sulfate transport system permease component
MCQETLATSSWRVLEQGEHRLVCQAVASTAAPAKAPVKIQLRLAEITAGVTRVLVSVFTLGGPLQSRQARDQARNLRRQIEAAARTLEKTGESCG